MYIPGAVPVRVLIVAQDIPAVLMIRERVDVMGNVRPMEPAEEIEALNIPPQQIGVIKELPVRRWLEGQEEWDRKYKRTAERVIRKRKHYEAKAQRLLDHARQQGGIHNELTPQTSRVSIPDGASRLSAGEIQPERRWGMLVVLFAGVDIINVRTYRAI